MRDGMAASKPGASASNGVIGWVPVAIAASLFAYFLQFLGPVSQGEVIRLVWNWVPSLDIALSFTVDGLSLTFALLISGIGTAVMLYSNSYLAGHPQYDRFALYLTSFMLAMLGLVLADNLIALFVFWELTTITSYLLIGFNNEEAKSRRSALQALLLTGPGQWCCWQALFYWALLLAPLRYPRFWRKATRSASILGMWGS